MSNRGSRHYEAWEEHDGEEWWEDLSEMAHLTEDSLRDELKRQYQGQGPVNSPSCSSSLNCTAPNPSMIPLINCDSTH
jgi:hypothetical protein